MLFSGNICLGKFCFESGLFVVFFTSLKLSFQTINGIASITPAAAMQSLSQLQYLFQEPNLFRFLIDRLDSVVQALVTQTSLVRSRHLNDFALFDDVSELLRMANNFICSVSFFFLVILFFFFCKFSPKQ